MAPYLERPEFWRGFHSRFLTEPVGCPQRLRSVPLKPEHDDLVLPLRPCLDNVYFDAGYQNRSDYKLPPDSPLRKSDAPWAAKLLKTTTR